MHLETHAGTAVAKSHVRPAGRTTSSTLLFTRPLLRLRWQRGARCAPSRSGRGSRPRAMAPSAGREEGEGVGVNASLDARADGASVRRFGQGRWHAYPESHRMRDSEVGHVPCPERAEVRVETNLASAVPESGAVHRPSLRASARRSGPGHTMETVKARTSFQSCRRSLAVQVPVMCPGTTLRGEGGRAQPCDGATSSMRARAHRSYGTDGGTTHLVDRTQGRTRT